MILYCQRGYETTVELNDDFFWKLFYSLKSIHADLNEAIKISGVYPSTLIKDGIEYKSQEIIEAFNKIQDYITESGVDSIDYDKNQKLMREDFLTAVLEDTYQNKSTHKPQMEFIIWAYILPLFGAFNPIDDES